MDWALDDTGDLDTENGDIKFVTGVDAVSQHCTIRLRTFLGEYWLNLLVGIDYFGKILIKDYDLAIIQGIFRTTILSTPGVTEILEFAMDLDNETRILAVTFRAQTEEGPFDYSEEFVLP